MIELTNVDVKQQVANELQELVKKINDVIDSAPLFLSIRVTQNPGQHSGKNAIVQVWVTETISY